MAGQTAQSTGEIESQIVEIQNLTGSTVTAIEEVGRVITVSFGMQDLNAD